MIHDTSLCKSRGLLVCLLACLLQPFSVGHLAVGHLAGGHGQLSAKQPVLKNPTADAKARSQKRSDERAAWKSADQKLLKTASMIQVQAKVAHLITKYKSQDILVVFDIDNTLLAMNQDLGSDQWFGWQNELLETDPESPDLVAKDFGQLLDVQATLYALSEMHPPEPKAVAVVKAIQTLKVKTIALTSRGPPVRNSTERELNRNAYDLSQSQIKINETARGQFLPYDPRQPVAHGLDAEIIKKLGTPRSVSYSAGVFLTAGQHKGYLLRTLVSRETGNRVKNGTFPYRAIVFVDDHERNCRKMLEAFRGLPVEVAAFHYTRELGNVERFQKSNKRHVVRAWKKLKKVLDRSFVR